MRSSAEAENSRALTIRNMPDSTPLHLSEMVGAARFELTTFWSRSRRATRLRYAPKNPNISKAVIVFPDRTSGKSPQWEFSEISKGKYFCWIFVLLQHHRPGHKEF